MAPLRPILAGLLAALALGCSDAPETSPARGEESSEPPNEPIPVAVLDVGDNISRDAHVGTASELFEDATAERHPGDGGGRAWLVELRERMPNQPKFGQPVRSVPRSSRARIRVGFEAGEEGIAEGGALYLQNSPFWHWDEAQASEPDAGGYTLARTIPAGITLEPTTYGGGIVGFEVRGRKLEAGEKIELVYGAGDAGAIVDGFADGEARVWLHVDADGDGVRKAVPSSPYIATTAMPPAFLLLRAPTTARPDEALEMRVSLVDGRGNAGYPFEGIVEIEAQDGLELPEQIRFEVRDRGSVGVPFRAKRAGYFRIRATATPASAGQARELKGESEPLLVRDAVPRVLWADLHGHSSLSDGTGTPDDYFRYARDIAALDVVALTDHDHWGMQFLDANPEMWTRIQAATERAHEPGRFVTVLGYEWTSWLHGHRHVLQFADTGPLFSSIDRERRYETPSQLWDALRGLPALTFAHHSAGGPVSTNWNYPPDPILEPVTEIVSVHGSSEAADSPRLIYSPVRGNFVRDVLDRGFTLGMIGSGDSHDGHPGLAHISSSTGSNGLAAIFSEDRTREGVLAALRARRVYATNGPRIFLRTTLDDRYEMGERIDAPGEAGGASRPQGQAQTHTLTIRVGATAPLDRVDVIRSGEILLSLDGEGETEWSRSGEVPRLERGDYLYVRAIQRDHGAAWSSPYFGPARDSEGDPASIRAD